MVLNGPSVLCRHSRPFSVCKNTQEPRNTLVEIELVGKQKLSRAYYAYLRKCDITLAQQQQKKNKRHNLQQ